MKGQQGIGYQMDLFMEQKMNSIRQSENGEEVFRTKAGKQERALAGDLMKAVCSSSNLKTAY